MTETLEGAVESWDWEKGASPSYGEPSASALGEFTVLRGNSGPVTEIQKLPVMSVSNRPQTKDSRSSERGHFLSGEGKLPRGRRTWQVCQNRGKHSVLRVRTHLR